MDNTSQKEFKMIIAGGKTGGHLFPAIAIAQALLRLRSDAKILFVGTGEQFETQTLSRYGFSHEKISSTGIKGKGIIDKIKAVFQIPISIMQALFIIIRFKPDIVVGVGGFSSGPVVLAAKLWGVRTAIQEQNSIAGITNRIVENFADVIFTSFKETKRLKQTQKIIYTGNPIRRGLANSLSRLNSKNGSENGYKLENQNGLKKFTILVTGGSQGARSINSSFVEALKLIEKDGEIQKYRIVHQTGATDEKRVLEEYKKLPSYKKFVDSDNSPFVVQPFFNDMPDIQASADLIICRAGAGTISEIAAIGKVALFVPYPYAADDHQTYNAKELADNGAAWIVLDSELSGELLKDRIEFAYSHPEELTIMAQRSKEFGNPLADEMIASICLKMVNS
ncbi:MAG: undecaprenyldiphospho-muramoylpentapeptide beta-N-acetylglucosaminyltransferase [Desulfamplus sp.]|nr:undecaprenyldiphospho-muramoylpentapeptide beta-N-acetylglucosaminyltransferase [Desulfamplus sp.]